MVAITAIHRLQTKSVDFTLAFPQADLEEEVYMLLPEGIVSDNQATKYVLKLNKSLYGLNQSAKNWYQFLSAALIKRGLKPTIHDPCVFVGERMVIITYVDDCLIFSPSGSDVAEKMIKYLQQGNENFIFTDQGSIQSYLGMDIKYDQIPSAVVVCSRLNGLLMPIN